LRASVAVTARGDYTGCTNLESFPRKMANVFKMSHEVRFARRPDARLPYPKKAGGHRVCITRKDDPALRLLTNRGRESSFRIFGLPQRGSPRTAVGQITRKYRLGKTSGYFPNTSTRCYTTTRRSNDTVRSQPRRHRRHKPYHGHKDEQTS